MQSRPLVGYINFCPRGGLAGSLAVEERTVEAVIDTAVHELIHTLFMSGGLFQDFLVDGGMQYAPPSGFPPLDSPFLPSFKTVEHLSFHD